MNALLNTAAVVGHNHVELKLTDAQMEAIAKTMEKLEEKLSSVVTDELNGIVVAIDAARKETQAGPFVLLKWFKVNVPAGTLALFPTPGSEVGDCPDKYKEPYYRDGKKKFKQTSFYLRFYLNHFPEGKRIAAALAHIAIAKDEKANQNAVPQEIRNLDPVALEGFREDLVKQQNTGVASIRSAIALNKQLDAVNELSGVSAAPQMDKNEDVLKVAKPIKVWNVEQPDQQWNLYSISGFMQFDPARAAELGGTFDALKLTAKRDQEEGGEQGGDKPVVINTNATLVARITDIHEFISNKMMNDPKRELYGLFLKDHIASANSDDLIESLSDIKLFVDGVLNIPAVQTRLEILTAKRAA